MSRRKKNRYLAQPIKGGVPDPNEIAAASDQDEDDEHGKATGAGPVASDAELLKSIRDDYHYYLDYWRQNREDMAIDMRFVSGDPWAPKDRRERDALNKPCLAPDELSQYIKQADNNRRQNKVGIQVNPVGEGATDEFAEHRAGYIRGVEYRSNAQAAYTTAFENVVGCGFGAFRLNLDYVDASSFAVEPRIRTIPNPFTVLPDPNAKEPDRSDMEGCFVIDVLRKSEFARKYPSAQKTSFTADDVAAAPDWLKGENVVVAEAWRVERKKRRKMQVKSDAGPTNVYEDEIPEKDRPNLDVMNDRTVYERKVVQYITNGVEILERNEWVGSRIPILVCFGEEIYVNEGGQSRLIVMSLIRRARACQTMLAYIASQEAELFGQAPRVPIRGFKGMFETQRDAWSDLNTTPLAFIENDIPDDWNPQWGPPPLPTRLDAAPDIAAYEGAYERWRRATQAAIGIAPLPSSAQRQNEKSGVALEKIQTAESTGTFHFVDNFNRTLQNCGWQINELLSKSLTEPRHVPIRKADDTHGLLYITTKEHGKAGLPEDFRGDVLVADHGEYDVTISTGPSFQSQREQANSFVDLLIQYIGKLPIPPPVQAQLLSLAIKMKNLGPIGDQIAKMLMPPNQDDIPPQAQAAIAHAQGMMQQMQQAIVELQKEKEGKVVENQGKKEIEEMKGYIQIILKKLELENDLAKAEVTAKIQSETERLRLEADLNTKLQVGAHDAAHDIAMQKDQQAHERDLAEQSHAQALEQQDQAGQQALTQQQMAAEQQPAQ